MSFADDTTLPTVGRVQDEDVVNWNGSRWSVFFDGTAHGLTTANLDVNAISVVGGVLYFATVGASNPPGVTGTPDDADLYSWNGSRYARVFDASAHGIPTAARVDGSAWVDSTHLYLSFSADTSITGLGPVQDEDVVALRRRQLVDLVQRHGPRPHLGRPRHRCVLATERGHAMTGIRRGDPSPRTHTSSGQEDTMTSSEPQHIGGAAAAGTADPHRRRVDRRRFLGMTGSALAVAGIGAWAGRVLEPEQVAAAADAAPDLYLAGTDGWIHLPPTPGDRAVPPRQPGAAGPLTTYIFGFRNVTGLSADPAAGAEEQGPAPGPAVLGDAVRPATPLTSSGCS